MFADSTWSDRDIGITVIVLAFVILLFCLYCVVKLLKSILKGRMAVWIRHTSNSNLPYCPCFTEYLLILMGAVLTFLVQSSSVFTSTLPPLVSVKAISLERAYPLTLGANLGTTTTAVIAALTQTKNIGEGLQIALCHFLFNLTGVFLFYPIPCTRFPIRMAKHLGNTTARYRWFAIFYVVILFLFLPLVFLGLAFAGSTYVIVTASIMFVILIFVVTINSLRRFPRCLPKIFHTWKWLPKWMRSLEPYDRLFMKLRCCVKLKRRSVVTDSYQAVDEGNISGTEVEVGNNAASASASKLEVASDEEAALSLHSIVALDTQKSIKINTKKSSIKSNTKKSIKSNTKK